MLAYVVRRVVLGVLALLGLSLASFWFFARQDATLKTRPVLPEYWSWLSGVFSGSSLAPLHQPAPTRLNPYAGTTLVDAVGHTAVLLAVAFLLVVVFGMGLALLAASRQGSVVDVVLRSLSYLAWGVPAFLLAMLVQKLVNSVGGGHGVGPFALAGWPGSCPAGLGLDAGQLQGCARAGSGLGYVANVLRFVTLPAATLAVGFIGLHGRYLRSALLETLEAPFITTAYAKGLSERRVILRHALRVSAATFLSAVLSDFGAIFGAAMAVDWIFELNGLGTVLVSEFPTGPGSIDTYSIQLVIVFAGVLIVATSFLAELTVGWLDPRVRAAP